MNNTLVYNLNLLEDRKSLLTIKVKIASLSVQLDGLRHAARAWIWVCAIVDPVISEKALSCASSISMGCMVRTRTLS